MSRGPPLDRFLFTGMLVLCHENLCPNCGTSAGAADPLPLLPEPDQNARRLFWERDMGGIVQEETRQLQLNIQPV